MTSEREARLHKINERIIHRVSHALDRKYHLLDKIVNVQPETGQTVATMFGRLVAAYGDLSLVKGQRVLDIGCGSNESRDPFTGLVTPMFEPWLCRILLELGAIPVGIDLHDNSGESFESYQVNLGDPSALGFLPDAFFDAVHDHRIFGSEEFKAQFPTQEDFIRIAREVYFQERRVLKPGGKILHTDLIEKRKRRRN